MNSALTVHFGLEDAAMLLAILVLPTIAAFLGGWRWAFAPWCRAGHRKYREGDAATPAAASKGASRRQMDRFRQPRSHMISAAFARTLVGSIPGIVVSSYFASRVPERVLRPLLAGTLAVVGFRLAI